MSIVFRTIPSQEKANIRDVIQARGIAKSWNEVKATEELVNVIYKMRLIEPNRTIANCADAIENYLIRSARERGREPLRTFENFLPLRTSHFKC